MSFLWMLSRQNNFCRYCRNRGSELLCYNFVSSPAVRDCRSVELRALCNEVPRTPPGPEGSNGTGIASCAPDHPKFLAPKKKRPVIGDQRSVSAQICTYFMQDLQFFLASIANDKTYNFSPSSRRARLSF